MASTTDGLLQQLAGCSFKTMHHRGSDGSRIWDSLAAACRSRAGQERHGTAQLPSDSQSHYMAVFDYAVQHRFGCWVLDYVAEVCGDTRLTSDDPLEAQLLDGTFVKAWCQQTLRSMENQLHNSLKSEAALTRYSSGPLQRDCQAAEVVVSALKSLERIKGSAAAAAETRVGGVADDLQQALQLQRVLQLVQWFVSHQLHAVPPTGRFASLPDWTRRVQARRDACAAHQDHTFMEDLIRVLASGVLAYPFTTPTQALASLASAALAYQATYNHLSAAAVPGAATTAAGNGSGAARPRGAARVTAGAWCVAGGSSSQGDALLEYWECCLAMLVYYMTDLDVMQTTTPPGQQLLSSFQATFQLPSSQLSVWCCAPLLDDYQVAQAGLGPDQAAGLLAQASAGLLAHAPARLHVKFLKVLTALGAPEVALALDRAQQQEQQEAARTAGDAWVLVECRLRCGLVAEAVALSRTLSRAQPDAASYKSLLTRLLRGVLDWAAGAQPRTPDHKAAVLELCCGPEEESILVCWLHDALLAGQPIAHLLPVCLATRGRIPEALSAFQLWSSACATHPGLTDPTRTHVSPEALATVQSLVDCVAEGLPQPLRNVVVEADDGAAAAPPSTPEDLLRGLSLKLDPGVLCMRVAPYQLAPDNVLPPALLSSVVGSRRSGWSQHTAAGAAGTPGAPGQRGAGRSHEAGVQQAGGAAGEAANRSSIPVGLSGFPAGGSTAFVGAPGGQAGGHKGMPAFGFLPATYQGGGGGVREEQSGGVPSFLPGPPTSSLMFGGEGGVVRGVMDTAAASRPLFALSSGPALGAAAGTLDTPINKRARPNTWSQH